MGNNGGYQPLASRSFYYGKNEHVVLRSSVIAALSVQFSGMTYFVAPMINLSNLRLYLTKKLDVGVDKPGTDDCWGDHASRYYGGRVLSASTFLSLIGFSIVNDVMQLENTKENEKRMVE